MATNSNGFKEAVEAANSGKKFPVMALTREGDPSTAAVISKLITPTEKPIYGQDGNRENLPPNLHMFQEKSNKIAESANDARTVMQMLPDLKLSEQILISSIISPKDMMSTDLTFGITEGLLPPDVSNAMIARTKTHFEQVHKIEPLLPKMLRAMLFGSGSFPIAVIPENSIDDVINGNRQVTMESLREVINPRDGSITSLGLLGPAMKAPAQARTTSGFVLEALNDWQPTRNIDNRVTLEGLMSQEQYETYLSVTDNHNLLKIPQINQKIREQRIVKTLGSRALESLQPKMNDRTLAGLLYKERGYGYKPINTLKTQEQLSRRAVGHPLVLHIPSEAVIPVYVPGNVEEQIGFFILLDADGNPLSKAEEVDYYEQMGARLSTNGSFPSAMLNKVKSMMGGFDVRDKGHLDYSARVYGNMVEQDLLARLRNGLYGNGVSIARKEEVYRIMFSRALAKQHTQLLFLPVELMTYFAFNHDPEGIGKSLLDDMKILNSLRVMLMFSNVMAAMKNSVGRTEVKLKLDPDDQNPQKTIETAMDEIVRSRGQFFPLGTNSPVEIVRHLQRAGMEFTFEGHPGLPDLAVDFGEKNSNYTKPDTELENSLRDRSIMATGLSPETIDATRGPEFATSVVTNNLLLSKRVMQMQEQLTPQLAAHMQKEMMNSEILLTDLREILESNWDKLAPELTEKGKAVMESNEPEAKQQQAQVKKEVIDQLLQEYIKSFEVSLPKPNSVTLENQMQAFEVYSDALDKALEAWISSKFFTTELGGEAMGQVDGLKELLRAHFLRQWLTENGVLTELGTLTTMASDGSPTVDFYDATQKHIEGLTKSLTKFLIKLKPIKDAADTVSQQLLGGVEDSSGATDSTSEDDSGGGDDFGMGDDDPYGGDIGGDDDTGGDDATTDTAGDAGGEAEGEEASPTDENTETDSTKPATNDDDSAAS